MSDQNYWSRMRRQRMTRRTLLGASAKAGVGAAGLALVGCGDDDDGAATAEVPEPAAPAAQPQAQAEDPVQPEAQADTQAQAAAEAVAQADKPRGGTLVTRDLVDPPSFDQFATFGYQAAGLFAHMAYPKLTKLKVGPNIAFNQFGPENWLAESIENPDPTTYVFNLQPNAVWENKAPTNGRPITSEDVAYTFGEPFETFGNRAAIAPHLDTVQPISDKSVQFNLNKPLAPFILYVGHQAGPQIYPFERANNEDFFRGDQVSGAAWTLESYDVGSKVVYRRNPDYWDPGPPYIEQVEWVFIRDPSTLAAVTRTGELDAQTNGFFGYARADARELMQEIPDGNWAEWPLVEALGVTVDIAAEPFNDPRVRQAMSNLLDRTGLLKVHDSDDIGAWTTALPALDFWWRNPQEDAELNPFYALDPQRASELLQAAEVDGISGVNLNTNVGYGPDFVEESTAIQAMFQAGGISLDLNQQEQAEYYATTFRGEHLGQVGHNRMVGTTEPDEPLTFIYTGDSPRSGVPNGELFDSDAKLQGLLNDQRSETDRDTRKGIIDELQAYIAEQMYVIHGVDWVITVYARPGLEDVHWISTFSPEPQFHRAWYSDL